jgi:ribosome-associated protein
MKKTTVKHLSEELNETSSTNLDPTVFAQAVAKVSIDQKALDVRILDLAGTTDIADRFVIASATSERHAKGIADKIKVQLKELGEDPISMTGYEMGDWILIDYGNVIVHVFYEPTRQYYKIDELWKQATLIPLPPELEEQARQLRTGIYLTISE